MPTTFRIDPHASGATLGPLSRHRNVDDRLRVLKLYDDLETTWNTADPEAR
jgi:hypothetical protein